MKKKTIEIDKGDMILWCTIGIIVSMVAGVYAAFYAEDKQMYNYDLYNCIYNNAMNNDFNQNPIMIEKIQNECICFREYNYTNLLEVDCSE